MEITSPSYDCSIKGHVNKSLKSEYYTTEDGKDVRSRTILWGCTRCDETSPEPFPSIQEEEIDHTKCGGPDVCFGCKVQTLQLSPGDAAGNKNGMSQKKWDKELNAYADARRQGIQPAGTTMAKIRDAVEKSNKAGKAFDANTGGFK